MPLIAYSEMISGIHSEQPFPFRNMGFSLIFDHMLAGWGRIHECPRPVCVSGRVIPGIALPGRPISVN